MDLFYSFGFFTLDRHVVAGLSNINPKQLGWRIRRGGPACPTLLLTGIIEKQDEFDSNLKTHLNSDKLYLILLAMSRRLSILLQQMGSRFVVN
jgi:hypothetical protein